MVLAKAMPSQIDALPKFKRGQLLAKSMKAQRELLAKARQALALGLVKLARVFLQKWETERFMWRYVIAVQTNA